MEKLPLFVSTAQRGATALPPGFFMEALWPVGSPGTCAVAPAWTGLKFSLLILGILGEQCNVLLEAKWTQLLISKIIPAPCSVKVCV